MKVSRGILVFSGLSLALWLALWMPGLEFARRAWIPISGWVVLGLLAALPRRMPPLAGVHGPTYGMVALAWGGVVCGGGALLAAAALLLARYSTAPGVPWERWATSPVLGALFVLLFLAAVVPMSAMTNRDLGAVGTTPLEEGREGLRSHGAPTRSAEEWRDSGKSGT